MSTRYLVIFSLFFVIGCDQGFCSHSGCGAPEEVTIVDAGVEDTFYSDISSELDETDAIEPRFCDWADPVIPEDGFARVTMRWTGDKITERDFFTDEVLSEEEFSFSPYISPQTYIIGVWCSNWVRTSGVNSQDFWTESREIPFLGQEFATFSADVPIVAQDFDYCYGFVSVMCASRGGGGCWHATELISGNENYPIVHINGSMEYCVNNSEVIDADINDNHFYKHYSGAYAAGFYLNEL